MKELAVLSYRNSCVCG